MTERLLLRADIRHQQDVVLVHQRARRLAALLGFEVQDQTRIATSVSEIARNALEYAGGGKAALLVDLPVEVVPSGYRTTSRPGHEHRRAVDLIRRDIDALEEAVERSGARPAVVKVQAAGPWTLTAGVVRLAKGDRAGLERFVELFRFAVPAVA